MHCTPYATTRAPCHEHKCYFASVCRRESSGTICIFRIVHLCWQLLLLSWFESFSGSTWYQEMGSTSNVHCMISNYFWHLILNCTMGMGIWSLWYIIIFIYCYRKSNTKFKKKRVHSIYRILRDTSMYFVLGKLWSKPQVCQLATLLIRKLRKTPLIITSHTVPKKNSPNGGDLSNKNS